MKVKRARGSHPIANQLNDSDSMNEQAMESRRASRRLLGWVCGIWAALLVGLAFMLENYWYIPLVAACIILIVTVLQYYVAEEPMWLQHYIVWFVFAPILVPLCLAMTGLIRQECPPGSLTWMLGAVGLLSAITFLSGLIPEWRELIRGKGMRLTRWYSVTSGEVIRHWPPLESKRRSRVLDSRWSVLAIGAAIGLASIAKIAFEAAWLGFGVYVLGPALIAGSAWGLGVYIRSTYEESRLSHLLGPDARGCDVAQLRAWRVNTRLGRLLNPHLRNSKPSP